MLHTGKYICVESKQLIIKNDNNHLFHDGSCASHPNGNPEADYPRRHTEPHLTQYTDMLQPHGASVVNGHSWACTSRPD